MSRRATFICGGELVPASRFRVHPVAAALGSAGWDVGLVHGYGRLDHGIAWGPARRAYRAACRVERAFRTAWLSRTGPVMVQRLAWPCWAGPELHLARRGRPLVFDFDDAVFLGADGRESRARRAALDAVFAAASHVVAGNSWLAGAVRASVPVTVVPTCIDTLRYRPGHRSLPADRVRVGWIGTRGNFPYLRQLVEPLADLRAAGHAFDFTICSDGVDQALFQALGADFESWSAESELAFLQSLDIGLMPLADDDWCRGKCSFKMIQYMAVGCPVVASAVGMNIDVLGDEAGGRLVKGGDWAAPLHELLGSEQCRLRAGEAARARAVAHYDVSTAVARYRRILEGLQ